MTKHLSYLVLVLLSFMLTSSATASGKKKASAFEDINFKDLTELISQKKVTLIDCNGSESYAKGHISGAIDGSAKDLKSKLPKDKASLIVSYCGSPKCTAWESGANESKKLGYKNIKHFSGGLKGWKANGGKLVATTK